MTTNLLNTKVIAQTHPAIKNIQEGKSQHATIVAVSYVDDTNYPQWEVLVLAEDGKFYSLSHNDIRIAE